MFKRILGLLICLSAVFAVHSQQNKYVNFKNIETSTFGKKVIQQQIWMNDGSFWAKTEDGIIHRNGYSGKEFVPESGYSNTVVSKSVGGLHKFSEDEIWIDYRDTCILTKFNPRTEEFTHYYVDELMSDGQLSAEDRNPPRSIPAARALVRAE